MPLKRIVLELSESSEIRLHNFSSFICRALIVKNNQNELLDRYIESNFNAEKTLFKFLLKYGDKFSTNPSVNFIDNDEGKEALDEFTFLYDEQKKDNVYYKKELSYDNFIDAFKEISKVSSLTELCKKLNGDEPNFSFLILQLGNAKNDFNNWINENTKQEKDIDKTDKSWFIDLALQELQLISDKKNITKFIFESV